MGVIFAGLLAALTFLGFGYCSIPKEGVKLRSEYKNKTARALIGDLAHKNQDDELSKVVPFNC